MKTSLQNQLDALKSRLVKLAAGRGAALALLAALGLLIGWMWIDLMVDLPPAMRVGANLTALAAAIYVASKVAMRAMRSGSAIELGRRIDQAAQARGQIVSGVDLMNASAGAAGETGVMSAGLRQIAIEKAELLASSVAAIRIVPSQPLRRVGMVLAMMLLFVASIFITSPRLAKTQIARFADPYGDHPPFSRITFDVDPGNTSVVYGGNVSLRVTPRGGDVENLEVVLQSSGAEAEALPMFPDSGGAWLATVTNITTPGKYFVRARGARTSKFDLSVITVPKISEVRFRITPPAYTHRPAYEGPVPQGGIAGLPGTSVQMWIKSNRPLSGGTIDVAAKPGASVAMGQASGADEVSGSFIIGGAGNLIASVVDTAGQRSRETFTAPITVLPDERPFVRVLEPKQASFATPSVNIPVHLSAEDDYGVASVSLYRGLNDLRATAQELPVPGEQPTRVPAESELSLKKYGLKPGDTLKLYARAEDNDPAGAKGSESPLATIHIISEEEMARLQLAEQGMEVLQSKYEQAMRRLEAIDKKIEELQKDLEKLDPNSELAKETRDKIEALADEISKQAEAMAQTAKQDLPFDLDKNFRSKLNEMTNTMRDAAKDAKSLAGIPKLSGSDANKKLDEMRKKLGTKKEDYQQQVAEPMEHLAKIFPLVEDQGRFIELYQRQRELEQRMQSLRGTEGKDEPQVKARMRNLEMEQMKVSQDLRELLQDIDNHVADLPGDPKLDDLRKTAKEFTEGVRASQADDQMTSAQASLAEFAGTAAHDSSKAAADILEKFIGKCNGMGEEGSACLKFSPSLSQNLGNTVQQLLEKRGLGSKPGQGMGNGGGYGARRSTLSNVGLYGHMPTRSANSKLGGGQSQRGGGADSTANRDDGSKPGMNPADGSNTVGDAAISVPPQYRTRVGEYFRRVADEPGEQK